MRLAIIYWEMVGQIGGIATHINTLRKAGIAAGDQVDILFCAPRTAGPHLFPRRRRIKNKDNWCWTDGYIPQHSISLPFLEKNYDALCFATLCPNQTKKYPYPQFRCIYDSKLPKVGFVMDGYWDEEPGWMHELHPLLQSLLVPLVSYATPLLKSVQVPVVISPFPFLPEEISQERSELPLLVWPHQWITIKGVKYLLSVIPQLPNLLVQLFGGGQEYYALRSTPQWEDAIGVDLFRSSTHNGTATYFGNVERNELLRAMQRAWYTLSFQGYLTKRPAYVAGSYNNTEVEALYYGACPILLENTPLPQDLYIPFRHPKDIPQLLSNPSIDTARQARAKEFVMDVHNAHARYQDLRRLLA